MIPTRRGFLQSLAAGAAATIALKWPRAYAAARNFAPALDQQGDGFIRLNSNENAYGVSRKVADAIQAAIGTSNRYPYPEYDALVQRIAAASKVNPDQVLLGCGSTEILRMAASAYLGKGKQLIQASPTFEAIEHYARATGAEVIPIRLTPSFAHDLEGMLAHVGPATSLVYICNPNNPTATLTARKDIEDFIRKLPNSTYVLIDEAYHHYAVGSGPYASFIELPFHDPRVIVTRTFSNVYALAGLRVGYAVASPGVVTRLQTFSTEDNINAIAVRAAAAALDDANATSEAIRRNANDLQEFQNQAIARMLRPVDSHANFVMINTFNPAADVIAHFRRHNILVGRRFPALDTYIRVSLGLPGEMRAFWRVWDLLPFAKTMLHH